MKRRQLLKTLFYTGAALGLPSIAAAQETLRLPYRSKDIPMPTFRSKNDFESAQSQDGLEISKDQQVNWVLEALAKKHGTAQQIPPTIIVDKVQSKIFAYVRNKKILDIDAITGLSGKDTIDRNKSGFKQKVTPAGAFDDINVIFDPNLKPEEYHNQMYVSFTPIEGESSFYGKEVAAFHSILNPNEDGLSLTDQLIQNRRLSNGCVRMGYNDITALTKFALQDKVAFYNSAQNTPKRNGVRVMPVSVDVLILPQEDRSKENTLAVTKLDRAGIRAAQPKPAAESKGWSLNPLNW